MTSASKELLEILQKRLVNDKSNLITMNRQVLLDMLYVFGGLNAELTKSESELATCRNDRYLDARRSAKTLTTLHSLLRRFSCECEEPCDTGKAEPCPRWGILENIGDK
jgi:hypothetical protein